jgi:hypothetical protein
MVSMGKSRTVMVVMGKVPPRASSAWGKLRDGRRRDGEVQKKGKMAEWTNPWRMLTDLGSLPCGGGDCWGRLLELHRDSNHARSLQMVWPPPPPPSRAKKVIGAATSASAIGVGPGCHDRHRHGPGRIDADPCGEGCAAASAAA